MAYYTSLTRALLDRIQTGYESIYVTVQYKKRVFLLVLTDDDDETSTNFRVGQTI